MEGYSISMLRNLSILFMFAPGSEQGQWTSAVLARHQRALPPELYSVVVALSIIGFLVVRVHTPKTGQATTGRAVVQLSPRGTPGFSSFMEFIFNSLSSFCSQG